MGELSGPALQTELNLLKEELAVAIWRVVAAAQFGASGDELAGAARARWLAAEEYVAFLRKRISEIERE